MVGGKIGTETLMKEQAGVGESGRADRIVDDAFPDRVEEMVLIHSSTMKTGSPQFRAREIEIP